MLGWRRSDVFITNVVKCRPPGNRDPEPDEIAACAPFLRRQLEILDAAVVVTLGRYSLGTFMPGAKISSAHGTVRPAPPGSGAVSATAYALYHPAAALRQAAIRDTLTAEMAGLPGVLLEARAARSAAGAAEPPTAELPATVVLAAEPPQPRTALIPEPPAAAAGPLPPEPPEAEAVDPAALPVPEPRPLEPGAAGLSATELPAAGPLGEDVRAAQPLAAAPPAATPPAGAQLTLF